MVGIIAIVAVVLAIIIAVVLVLASAKPATFRIERSAVMRVPADKIFPLVNNFREWTRWSPWEARDPDMKRTYSGAESGKGAVYGWEGKKAGSGRMEILNAPSPSRITIKLDFFKPFEGHNTAEFTFAPDTRDTSVTNVVWVMQGPASLMSKVMQVFMNIDKMIGKDFETGLANLKKLTEI